MIIMAAAGLALCLPCGAQAQMGKQPASSPTTLSYCVVDTGQAKIFSDSAQLLKAPRPGEAFFGQNGFYQGQQPSYRDNKDGTISDLNTGLTWVKARGEKVTWKDALAGASTCRVGGHSDWRMPTIKELYSLINFNGSGATVGMDRGPARKNQAQSTPYIDTRFFDFKYGDQSKGERLIDCQDWSATTYVGTTMGGNPTAFGVNFADGRIKGYPKVRPGPGGAAGPNGENMLFVRYVRGNPSYGKNDFHDNDDGTISDQATGLMWSRDDSGKGMNWSDSLAWVQAKNKERYLGHDDWRLPNAKELQSIVDYTRAPQATDVARQGPAIAPVFHISKLTDGDYPYFWTGTTHLDGPPDRQACSAAYVAFGRALGWMQFPPGRGDYKLMDVHGAGAQRSDPKSGDPAEFPHGRGPQGDVIRILNYVRLVRNIDPKAVKLVAPDLTPLPGPAGGREPPPQRLP